MVIALGGDRFTAEGLGDLEIEVDVVVGLAEGDFVDMDIMPASLYIFRNCSHLASCDSRTFGRSASIGGDSTSPPFFPLFVLLKVPVEYSKDRDGRLAS